MRWYLKEMKKKDKQQNELIKNLKMIQNDLDKLSSDINKISKNNMSII